MPHLALARRCQHATDVANRRAHHRRRSPRSVALAATIAAAVVVCATPLLAPRPAAAMQQRQPSPKVTRPSRQVESPARRRQPPKQRPASEQRETAAYAAPIVAVAALPVLPPVPARSGDLTGIVTDSDGVAIPSAEVFVVAFGVVVYTDEKGAFRLPALPPGDHELRVRRIGFHPRTRTLSVQQGESWQLLVSLDPAPVTLTPVGVTASAPTGKMAAFERRRHGNVGVFITRDQISARRAMHLSDIMRTMPGVTMAHGRTQDKVQMRPAPLGGRFDCSPDFYVDGLYVPGLDIDAIPPNDVQGIELYRGPSDTPVDFRSMNAPCGVVAIWTRDPEDKRQLP